MLSSSDLQFGVLEIHRVPCTKCPADVYFGVYSVLAEQQTALSAALRRIEECNTQIQALREEANR